MAKVVERYEQKVATKYRKLLDEVKLNRRKLIYRHTRIAQANTHNASILASVIHGHITSPDVHPDAKLPVLYLIDSIVKNVHSPYSELFSGYIIEIICKLFAEVSEQMREKMRQMRETWKWNVFSIQKLKILDIVMSQMDRKWPVVKEETDFDDPILLPETVPKAPEEAPKNEPDARPLSRNVIYMNGIEELNNKEKPKNLQHRTWFSRNLFDTQPEQEQEEPKVASDDVDISSIDYLKAELNRRSKFFKISLPKGNDLKQTLSSSSPVVSVPNNAVEVPLVMQNGATSNVNKRELIAAEKPKPKRSRWKPVAPHQFALQKNDTNNDWGNNQPSRHITSSPHSSPLQVDNNLPSRVITSPPLSALQENDTNKDSPNNLPSRHITSPPHPSPDQENGTKNDWRNNLPSRHFTSPPHPSALLENGTNNGWRNNQPSRHITSSSHSSPLQEDNNLPSRHITSSPHSSAFQKNGTNNDWRYSQPSRHITSSSPHSSPLQENGTMNDWQNNLSSRQITSSPHQPAPKENGSKKDWHNNWPSRHIPEAPEAGARACGNNNSNSFNNKYASRTRFFPPISPHSSPNTDELSIDKLFDNLLSTGIINCNARGSGFKVADNVLDTKQPSNISGGINTSRCWT